MPTLPGKLAADLRIAAAGPRPAAAGLGLLSPWTEWFSPADRKPGPAAGEAGPFQSLRWRGPLALGLVLATGMCAAASTGVSIQFLERRHLRRREAAACGDRRDAVGEWGKRRATEAAALGWLMVRERDFAGDASTFLVPGPLSDGLSLHRLDELSPTYHQTDILWLPTVTQADRPAFEAYLGGAYGGERNITDARSEYAPPENPPENQRLSHVLLADDWAPWNAYDPETAPNRKTYNPVAVVWAAPSSDRPKMDNHVGWDLQERNRRLLPESLYTRLLESHKLIAHPPYDAVGEGTDSAPMADRGLTVQMPFVFADSGVSPGFFYFTLPKDEWNSIFPANLEVSGAETGHLIKTVSPGYGAHVHAHEPFLDLSVKCFYDETHETTAPYVIGTIVSPVVFVALLLLLRKLELGAARERRQFDELCRDAARDAEAAERTKGELLRHSFEMSEKTERYLNHELKNRIFVLGQSYADPSLHRQIDEITEVLSSKAALMRLSTGRYKPSWDAVEPTALIALRWRRHDTANSPFNRAKTTGAAAHRTKLRFDKVLFNIILDNMLSNAYKYGDAARPPSLSLNVEPLNECATRVRLSLELREELLSTGNWAGPEHAALLQMGEEKLNEVAHAEGQRAHEHTAKMSSGDGFPMAAAAASALGGTLRLVLLLDGVVAKLELPDVAVELPGSGRFAAVTTAPVELDLSWLKIAMADDSAMFRKMIAMVAEKVTSCKPVVAGATRESIDGFPKMVVESDMDVVLLDFNFAPVHHTKTGVDLCRECRQLDAEEGNVPRLIFIVSANDSPEDAERYRAAGADGSLGKKLTAKSLRQVLEDAVRTHPRFAARGDAAADLVVAFDSRRCLDAEAPPSPRWLASDRPRRDRLKRASSATAHTGKWQPKRASPRIAVDGATSTCSLRSASCGPT